MNIKEIEERSGLTRANVRYYEKEGLLSPGRRENGYRDYSEADQEPFVPCPWKRFLARMLDITLCELIFWFIWTVILKQVMGKGLGYDLLNAVAGMALMLVLEPLLLACLGTTPGKWIFGLYVSDQDGKKLSYSVGMRRTTKILIWGMGLQIPLFDIYRLYRSYKTYVNGRGLSWDREGDSQTEVFCQEKKTWKTAAGFILILAVVYGGRFTLMQYQLLPPNRGELTAEGFVENYNYYVSLLGKLTGTSPSVTSYLDQNGKYRERIPEANMVYIDFTEFEPPEWICKTEDGVIKEASFEINMQTTNAIAIDSYKTPITCAILALGGAWEDASVWNRKVYQLMKQTDEIGFGDFEFTECGIHVNCRMEYNGKKIPEGEKDAEWLWQVLEGINSFHIKFAAETVE